VLTNDSFAPDTGETLTVTAVTPGSNGGTVSLVGGVVSYTPAANVSGTETFTYTITDGNTGTATATVTMTITAVNDNPTAVNDAATVAANSAASSIDVLANDSSAPDAAETLTIGAVTQGTNAGVVTITGSGTGVTYQPAAGFSGTETFTYTVGDGNGGTATATVTTTVTPNVAPVVTMTASPLIYLENSGAVAIDPALTVTDIDSPNLVSGVVRIASNFAAGQDVLAVAAQNGITGVYDAPTGVLTLTGSATLAHYETALRSVTYLNTSEDPGAAPRSIEVVVHDGTAVSNAAARSVVPQAVNDAPTLDQPAAIAVDEDSGVYVLTLTGISSGAAAEVQALGVTAVSGDTTLFAAPAVSYTSPAAFATLTFTPLPDAFGTATMTVTVADGGAANASITRTVAVTIRPINDPPTLNAIADRSGAVAGTAQSVSLGGIGTGVANEIQTLSITAVSSNPSIVANPVITYSTPSATGVLQFLPLAAGSAQITVTVNDGGAQNATVSRTFSVSAGPNLPPTISVVAPMSMIEGNALAPAAFAVADDATPAALLTVTAWSSNTALVAVADVAFAGTGANRTVTVTPQRYRIGVAVITLVVSDGQLSASTTFSVTVAPLWEYYLTEGSTSGGFVTDIRVTNPHAVTAPIRIIFVRDDGTRIERLVDVPAVSRHSIRINDFPEVANTGVSAFIRSMNGLPLLVERTMSWGESGYGGHSETALESTSTRWYFAEGAQSAALSTKLVIANPNFEATGVRVTFLRGSRTVTKTYVLPPVSRQAIALATIPELSAAAADPTFGITVESDLPTVAERSMYLDGPRQLEGGSVSAGAPYPATEWYFAEGSAWQTFSTYVLVANPNQEEAHVTLSYRTMSGLLLTSSHSVGAQSRITVDTMAAAPRLNGEHFWIHVSADRPVVAERTMYWDRTQGRFIESHTSHGAYQPALRWSTGDARVGGAAGFSSFLLLANPTAEPAMLRVTFYRDSGLPIVATRMVGAGLRANIHVNSEVPQLSDESFWATIESTNGVPIVVERSVYWNSGGQFTAAGTNVRALPIVPLSYNGCEFTISPRPVIAPAAGGSIRIAVGATSRCTYVATSSADWITLAPGASGHGVGVVEFIAAANASGIARTGQVTVAGRVISVSQGAVAAASPVVLVTTIAPSIGPIGGGTAVTIAGTNFRAGATVAIGGVPATGVTIVNATTITATAGAHTAGTFHVSVTNPAAAPGTLLNGFTYGTRRPVLGDFDGDRAADLALFRPSNGDWMFRTSASGFTTGATLPFGLSTDKPVPGDYDGDGKLDMALYRPSNGIWYVIYSSTGALAQLQWGIATDVPMPADYTGDGRTDLCIWRPSTGVWFIFDLSTGTFSSRQWGISTDIPLTGDYDGDGLADVAAYRPSTGVWWVFFSSTQTYAPLQWGIDTDIPVPADYTGDGRTDLAVYRPSNGHWFVFDLSTGTYVPYQWGVTGDVPVPKDYDGDGRTDLAIWRPSTGTWWIYFLGTNTFTAVAHGASGDVPVK
jgi:hypothetical protein